MIPRPRQDKELPAGVSRWVNSKGQISLAGFGYAVGATSAGEPVEAVVVGGLVQISHRGVLAATHAQRRRPDQADRGPRARRMPTQRRARDATIGLTVTRKADGAGVVSFAGSPYACGRAWARADVQVAIVAGSVQLAVEGRVIRVHPIRHDRAKELGAFATPNGRPRRAARSGLVRGPEQRLTVLGAEQEPEAVQVLAEKGDVVALGAEEPGQ